MTKEQEEAIDRLEKLVTLRRNKNTIKYDNCICSTSDLNTVLSLIKEQQEEINDLKEIKEIADMEVTELRKIKEVNKLKSDNWILQEKNEQKDKIIELMSRAIDNYDSQLVINTFKDKEHVKQYFEKKAEQQ